MQDYKGRGRADDAGAAGGSTTAAVGKHTLTQATTDGESFAATVGKHTLTSQIMRSAAGAATASGGSASLNAAATSTGAPLPGELSGRLGQALGTDVSGVRVHTGAASAAAAADINAHAYATGQDIHFAAGQYAPGSKQGQRLIAHEVAHTVQQRGGSGGVQAKAAGPSISSPDDAHEVEAERFADSFVSGGGGPVTQVATSAVSRQGGGGGGAGAGGTTGLPPEIANLTLEQCQRMVRDMYLGTGDVYAQRGILNHKIDAVFDMQVRLNQSDPPSLGSQLLVAAITVGAAAAAGASGGLSAVFTTPIGGALTWGAAALVSVLPSFFPSGAATLNPNQFTQNYLQSLRESWPTALSTDRLNSTLGTDVDQARRATAEVKRLRDDPERVKNNQRGELLDEWTNALRTSHPNGDARGGMGDASYSSPTEGRLHLEGAQMTGPYALSGPQPPATWSRGPDRATLQGVPGQDARNVDLDRKLKDIPVARTMGVDDAFGRWRIFDAALTPTNSERLQSDGHALFDDGMKTAKARLAQYAAGRYLDPDADQSTIESSWGAGLTKVWDQVRNKTLREMGITSVGV